jgi:hypothetical protein
LEKVSTGEEVDAGSSGVYTREQVQRKETRGGVKRSIKSKPVEGSFEHVNGAFANMGGQRDGDGRREESWFVGDDSGEV